MKHLKLFESFSKAEKIEKVNSLMIDHFLFKFFVENDVFVKYENIRGKTRAVDIIGFLIDFDFISGYGKTIIAYDRNLGKIQLYDQNYIFSKTFEKQKWVNKELKSIILENSINPMFRYIEYLRNTPDKIHLLQK